VADRGTLLAQMTTEGRRGFEVGPLMSPFVAKGHHDVIFVDRLSTEALRTKFVDEPNVEPRNIVEVDVVIPDGSSLADALRGRGPFDYATASHVIEHVPDLVGWLADVAELTRVGGRLLLVVPDKRYTFDYLRDLSCLPDALGAWIQRYTRPSPRQVFDYNAYASAVDTVAAWSLPPDPSTLLRYGDLKSALDLSVRSHRDQQYVDSHCWVVTPRRFLDILGDLAELGILRWRLAFFADTRRDELDFGVVLERTPERMRPDEIALTFRTATGQAAANDAAGAQSEEIAALRSEISALRLSRSWRLTGPLRSLAGLVKHRLGA